MGENQTPEDVFETLWASVADRNVKEMLKAIFVYLFNMIQSRG